VVPFGTQNTPGACVCAMFLMQREGIIIDFVDDDNVGR